MKLRVLVVVMATLGLMSCTTEPPKGGPPDLTATAISSSGDHTCALENSGKIRCWGVNDRGQLGNGTTTYSAVAVRVSGISDAVGLSVNGDTSCAVLGDGTARCWGANSAGQLGNGTTSDSTTPTPVNGLTDATSVSVGGNHACAVKGDTTVACWGANSSGQLGNGTTINSPTPVVVPSFSGATALSATTKNTCALLSSGGAKCWGDNYWGQLGNGEAGVYDGMESSAVPMTVIGLTDAVQISIGGSYACARLDSGILECWGYDHYISGGGFSILTTSTPSHGVSDAIYVDTDASRMCVVGADNRVSCWGYIYRPDLSGSYDGDWGSDRGFIDAKSVSGSCALRQNGKVQCIGDNHSGRLGNGQAFDPAGEPTPQKVTGLKNATGIAIGYDHSCVTVTNGKVICWGTNDAWQLRSAIPKFYETAVPVEVPGSTDVTSLTSGPDALCSVDSTGTVDCWGGAVSGWDTTGTFGMMMKSVDVDSVATGYLHACAVLNDASVECWGDNSHGQLGDGNMGGPPWEPVAATGVQNAVEVGAGDAHSCALIDDGTILCWGVNNQGQLGNGTNTTSAMPVQVTGITDAVAISVRASTSCAVLGDGTISCWGHNDRGQLGNGTTTASALPVQVTGITDATGVAVGWGHTCATSTDGTASCWGRNDQGQLGNGTMTSSTIPTPVTGLTNVSAVDVGYKHSCAVLTDGRVRCWGSNQNGIRGDGSIIFASQPVNVVKN